MEISRLTFKLPCKYPFQRLSGDCVLDNAYNFFLLFCRLNNAADKIFFYSLPSFVLAKEEAIEKLDRLFFHFQFKPFSFYAVYNGNTPEFCSIILGGYDLEYGYRKFIEIHHIPNKMLKYIFDALDYPFQLCHRPWECEAPF